MRVAASRSENVLFANNTTVETPGGFDDEGEGVNFTSPKARTLFDPTLLLPPELLNNESSERTVHARAGVIEMELIGVCAS